MGPWKPTSFGEPQARRFGERTAPNSYQNVDYQSQSTIRLTVSTRRSGSAQLLLQTTRKEFLVGINSRNQHFTRLGLRHYPGGRVNRYTADICDDLGTPRRPRLILNPVQKLRDMGQEATGWLDRSLRAPNHKRFTRRDVASSAQWHTGYGAAIPHNTSIEYFPAPVMYNSKKPPIMLRFL